MKKSIIEKFLEKKILLSPDLFEEIQMKGESVLLSVDISDSVVVLNKDIISINNSDIDFVTFDKIRVLYEKNKDEKKYQALLSVLKKETSKRSETTVSENTQFRNNSSIEIIFNYEEPSKKRSYSDFVDFFNMRFSVLEKILRKRQELHSSTSINRVLQKKEKETISIIGMVYEKSLTKNNNIIIKLEDSTGFIDVMISKNREDIYEQAKDICLDEVIGVTGSLSGNSNMFSNKILFVNNLYFPDVPADREYKKLSEEKFLIVLGDPQVGSDKFLEKEFHRFLLWIQGKIGNDVQREIAKKTKYILIPGDLIEGVGVYPGQEEELLIKDIKEQYSYLASLLSNIPSDKEIIVCPGNHDAGRLAEPQPPLYKDFAETLWNMPNVHILSNPALINIEKTKDFPGFDILIYHGSSLIYYSENIDSIRTKGGQKRPDLLMKYLLQKRHLSPTHEASLYVPDPKRDPLVIETVPDFLITGHIHRSSVSNYKNTTLINASCWVDISENQIKRGLEPEPARVPIINLQTRDVKIMNFSRKKESKQEIENYFTEESKTRVEV
ncbi:MAG: metallophosphoesterase [Candidatus Woesearchaeota archaeon]